MVTSNLVNLDEKIAVKVKGISASGIRKFFDLLQGMSGVISLGVGEPDFVTPAHILNAARQSIDAGHTAYTSNFGTMELRKEISKFLEGFSKTTYDPTSEILVTVGGSEANDLALRCIINPGDEIIIVEPCFVAYKPIIQISHGVPVCIPSKKENNFRPDIEAIRAAVTPKTKAIFINFPCNPSGVALTKEEAEAISEIVIENDLILISDEIYGQLTYEGEHISFPSIPGMKERTILTTGFSKAYAMTGWRMGYAAAPAPLIANMVKIHQYSMMSAPTIAQDCALEAYKNGEKDRIKMLDAYSERRKIIHKGFLDLGFFCPYPGGAFYVFPDISSTGLTSDVFAERLLMEEKVAVVPGHVFGDCGEGFIRCCYASSTENIKEALVRIGRFVEKVKKEK